ncbi:MAG TPA: FAD binding domain-containing protein [Acidobacteriaceae bacterium]|jgi:CO/xanthine dehydrogenase FAD-binding subunit
MRSDVSLYDLTAPASLNDVLARLAAEPGRHSVIAGGTELMVALNTGRLAQRSLLSIQHLRELRFIRVEEDAIHLGSGTTFTDIRRHELIAKEFPLLSQAASWTGSVANQNRGTLGGNLCNASPAADSPPTLLAYDATVTLISASGERTVPYGSFHLGYKKTVLRPEELVHSITVPRAFNGYRQSIRKVGTRNAQAISKIALAMVARVEDECITDIRIGAASLADRPIRCTAAEAALVGRRIEAETFEALVRDARAALASEAKPIDDIRSTAKYRATVAANLLEEFLRSL